MVDDGNALRRSHQRRATIAMTVQPQKLVFTKDDQGNVRLVNGWHPRILVADVLLFTADRLQNVADAALITKDGGSRIRFKVVNGYAVYEFVRRHTKLEASEYRLVGRGVFLR